MTFDSGYPTSSDAVVASTLQANFAAIENGTVNHDQLTLAKQSAAPNGVADKMLIYGIEDTQTEFYVRGADDNAVQLTQDGKMGSSTTEARVKDIRFGSETVAYDDSFLPRAWGEITSGATGGDQGFTTGLRKNFVSVSKQGGTAGHYQVVITGLGDAGADFADGDGYIVIATAGSSSNRMVSVSAKAATTFDLRVTDNTGAAKDAKCSVMLYKA